MPDKLLVVAAEDHHLVHVAANLREADRQEAEASGEHDVLEVFRMGTERGRTWAVLTPEGEACLVGGVVPDGPSMGLVWMMGTDAIMKHRKEFVRRSRSYVDALHQIHPILTNMVHAKNRRHIQWLRWAGFVFTRRITLSNGEEFINFVRMKNV